jgi:hypothetical protein
MARAVSAYRSADGDPVGSLAEEVARLIAALHGPPPGGEEPARDPGADDRPGDGHTERAQAECRGCPVCRLLGSLRESRPEVFEHLSTAAAAIAAAVAELVATHEQDWSARRGGGVEHIDIT